MVHAPERDRLVLPVEQQAGAGCGVGLGEGADRAAELFLREAAAAQRVGLRGALGHVQLVREEAPPTAQERAEPVRLAQRFQVPEIAASAGGVPLTISDAKMRGEEIRFNALQKRGDATINLEFSGRISGDALNGTVRLIDAQARNLEWAATRSERGKIRLD